MIQYRSVKTIEHNSVKTIQDNGRLKFSHLLELTLYQTIPGFKTLGWKAFENTVGKEENAGNQHFLLFPTMFSTLSKKYSII